MRPFPKIVQLSSKEVLLPAKYEFTLTDDTSTTETLPVEQSKIVIVDRGRKRG